MMPTAQVSALELPPILSPNRPSFPWQVCLLLAHLPSRALVRVLCRQALLSSCEWPLWPSWWLMTLHSPHKMLEYNCKFTQSVMNRTRYIAYWISRTYSCQEVAFYFVAEIQARPVNLFSCQMVTTLTISLWVDSKAEICTAFCVCCVMCTYVLYVHAAACHNCACSH